MPTPQLKRADNGYYYAVWCVARRSRRQSMGTKDPSEAETRFAQWILVGGHRKETAANDSAPAPRRLTFQDCWDHYMARHVERKTADPRSIRARGAVLTAFFGALTVPEINQSTVEAFIEARTSGKLTKKGVGATLSTCRTDLVVLAACLRFCASPKEALIPLEALKPFDLPPSGAPRDRWLTTEERQRLLLAAAGTSRFRLSRIERFIWIALETGARSQAILDLTWDRVDFETKVIHFQDPSRRETKKRRASVPVSEALLPVLRRAYTERTNQYVLTTTSYLGPRLRQCAVSAGLEDAKGRRVTPHVLRHTAATYMARAGVPLWIIAKVLGNTVQMVESTYAKHCPDDLRAAVSILSNPAEDHRKTASNVARI